MAKKLEGKTLTLTEQLLEEERQKERQERQQKKADNKIRKEFRKEKDAILAELAVVVTDTCNKLVAARCYKGAEIINLNGLPQVVVKVMPSPLDVFNYTAVDASGVLEELIAAWVYKNIALVPEKRSLAIRSAQQDDTWNLISVRELLNWLDDDQTMLHGCLEEASQALQEWFEKIEGGA